MAPDLFTQCLSATLAGAADLDREPTPAECPSWCAMTALLAQGIQQTTDDPFTEAAFWEYVAWASVELFGSIAGAFAQTCRGLADEAAAGIAV